MVPENLTTGNSASETRARSTFTSREIVIMQGLINGVNRSQFEETFHIPYLVLQASKGSLAERFGREGTPGLYLAVAEAVNRDLLDLSGLPKRFQVPPDDFEQKTFALAYKGTPTKKCFELLGIDKWGFEKVKKGISKKLGVSNFYAVVAWWTRELKSHGQL